MIVHFVHKWRPTITSAKFIADNPNFWACVKQKCLYCASRLSKASAPVAELVKCLPTYLATNRNAECKLRGTLSLFLGMAIRSQANRTLEGSETIITPSHADDWIVQTSKP